MRIGVGGLVTTRDGVEKKTADLLNKRRGRMVGNEPF